MNEKPLGSYEKTNALEPSKVNAPHLFTSNQQTVIGVQVPEGQVSILIC